MTGEIRHPSAKAKRDCFAYSAEQFAADGGCVICKTLLCDAEGKCPFYKHVGYKPAEKLYRKGG